MSTTHGETTSEAAHPDVLQNEPTAGEDHPAGQDAELMAALAAAFGDDAGDLAADLAVAPEPTAGVDAASTPNAPAEDLQALIDRLDAAVAAAGSESIDVTPASAVVDAAAADRHVVVEIADRPVAVPLSAVREIGRFPAITPLPRTPRHIRGIANFRGEIISVTDPAMLTATPSKMADERRKVVVVASDASGDSPDNVGDAVTAMAVDRVVGIRTLDGSPKTIPPSVDDPLAALCVGLAPDNATLVLSPSRLLK